MKRKALRITQGKNFDLLFKISRNLFLKEVDTSPHVRGCKTVWDPGFHSLDSGFQVQDSNRYWVSGLIERYYGFQSPGFRITQEKLSWMPAPTKNFPVSGIWITSHGVRMDVSEERPGNSSSRA